MSFESQDNFAQVLQERYAVDLYSGFWNVDREKIFEIDRSNREGDGLANLLDTGSGVDKIISMKGNLFLAQRMRRYRNGKTDFTIRRAVPHDWDAEYSKLRENLNVPSLYVYAEASKKVTQLVDSELHKPDVRSYSDVDISAIDVPVKDAFEYFHIVDLEEFLEYEFGGKLQKKRSPRSHNNTNDKYYFQNDSNDDNGFYAWPWLQLKQHGLLFAELDGDQLVPAIYPRSEKEDITKWGEK